MVTVNKKAIKCDKPWKTVKKAIKCTNLCLGKSSECNVTCILCITKLRNILKSRTQAKRETADNLNHF